MASFYLSPNAVGLIPILVLQLIFLVVLLRRPKSTAVYFLIAWLTSMFLVIFFNFLAYALYIPVSRYFMGIGSMAAAMLSAALWVQVAYHFPRLQRPFAFCCHLSGSEGWLKGRVTTFTSPWTW